MTGNLLFDQYVIYFFIYSILGYCGEVLYCSIPAKHFVNRGFMYGPWLPIYGFGGLAVRCIGAALVRQASSVQPNPVVVFILSMIVCSIIEYIGSWILQKWFNVKLWDYSKYKCNIHGRVCLLNSTLFGLAALLMTYVIHPLLSTGVKGLPEVLVPDFSKAILAVMSADATASMLRMAGFKRGLMEIKEKGKQFEERLSLLKESGSKEALEAVRLKWEEEFEIAKEKFARGNKQLFDAFPTMTSSNLEIKGQIEAMKVSFRNLKDKHFRH